MNNLKISNQNVEEGMGKNWTRWRALLDTLNVKKIVKVLVIFTQDLRK